MRVPWFCAGCGRKMQGKWSPYRNYSKRREEGDGLVFDLCLKCFDAQAPQEVKVSTKQ